MEHLKVWAGAKQVFPSSLGLKETFKKTITGNYYERT